MKTIHKKTILLKISNNSLIIFKIILKKTLILLRKTKEITLLKKKEITLLKIKVH